MEIGPSASFRSLHNALSAVQNNETKSAVVVHIDRDSQNPSILAVYIKSLTDAAASRDPVRATLHTSMAEEESDMVILGEHNETSLANLIFSVLTVEEKNEVANTIVSENGMGSHLSSHLIVILGEWRG
jgi:hypothetical protein